MKKGDIVVYIKDGPLFNAAPLEIGKCYTVRDNKNFILSIEENGYSYNRDRFVLLEKYRSMKINKLKNRINEDIKN